MTDLKKTAGSIVSGLGLPNAYTTIKKSLTGSQVVIVHYHRISPPAEHEWLMTPVSPQSFERQVRYLQRNFEIMPLETLVSCLRDQTLPKNSAAITLDDGYKDNYTYAYPILQKYRVPATIFLITGHIGSAELFWWDKVQYVFRHTRVSRLELDSTVNHLSSTQRHQRTGSHFTTELTNMSHQKKILLLDKMISSAGVAIPTDLAKQVILSAEDIKEMASKGIDFGAHTVTHPNLTRESEQEARHEIVRSKKHVEEFAGKECTLFAYPLGAFNGQVERIVAQSGYVAAVTSKPGWITASTDPYQLGRIGVTDDFDQFQVVLSTLWKVNWSSKIGRSD